MSRIGLTFGRLTVLSESPGTLRCRCECGREGLYPAAITKPSYKGRRQCAHCAGRPCEICGKWIEATSGQQSPTCSPRCRKIRAARKEKERYEQVKRTPAWRAVRAAYLAGIKERLEDDPTFAEIYRAYRRKAQADYAARISADPAEREAFLRKKRENAASWRAQMRADPAAHAAHLAAAREWYRNLSPEDRERIFYAPRRARMATAAR